jgi:hypothetical protein
MTMQNPNLSPTNVLWLSACTATLLWFLYWIFYDLIVWGKQLVQVNPLNYFGVALALTFMLFSGFGARKFEAACYLGSTAGLSWFTYWITYDFIVWNKTLGQINVINYAGVALSLALAFVPKAVSLWKSKEKMVAQPVVQKKSERTSKRLKKQAVSTKKS